MKFYNVLLVLLITFRSGLDPWIRIVSFGFKVLCPAQYPKVIFTDDFMAHKGHVNVTMTVTML